MNTGGSTERPLPNTYWVIPGRFAAGEYPGAKDPEDATAKLRALLGAGIDHFIDLTARHELAPYASIADEEAERLGITVVHERHPIPDVSVPPSEHAMSKILDSIDDALEDGKTVYVHCWGGVGRTGTVVGCWLVRHGWLYRAALNQITEWWSGTQKADRLPHSPETWEQVQYVCNWTESPRDELPESDTRDRFRGALLGLATGDALGTTLEFRKPGTFEPIDGMVGGGPFDLKPGEWTDDTSMALCLAQSLIERGGFDAVDQMGRYVRWWQEGYLSSTGGCFDIGTTARSALTRFLRDGDPYAGPTDPRSAGNGSLMRLAPVPMAFSGHAEEAIGMAARSSRTTHGTREAIDACRYFAGLLVGALQGVDKEILLSPGYCPVEGLWEREPLAEGIARVANGSFKHRNPPDVKGTGYVVDALEAALWAFHRSEDFREGALLAVNLGDDADTTGAIYGQIAGAYYGAEAIPWEWRSELRMERVIVLFADHLNDQARERLSRELGSERVGTMAMVREEPPTDVADVTVRWLSVIVAGHIVEQVLTYDVAEAEAIFGRPFDHAMDYEMQMGMHAVDRIWLGETLGELPDVTSYVVDGRCIRVAKIERCEGFGGTSACIPNTPPISHRTLIVRDDDLDPIDEVDDGEGNTPRG